MTSFLLDTAPRTTPATSRYLQTPLCIPGGGAATNNKRCHSPATFEAFTPFACGSYNTAAHDSASDAEYLVDQDETSFCVTIEMPGVRGKDIHVSVEEGMLTISGYRRLGSTSKKQRLQKRLFPVDTQVVDVTRAVATIYKDALVLYAPKRSKSISRELAQAEEEDELLELML